MHISFLVGLSATLNAECVRAVCAETRGHHKLVRERRFESQMAQNDDDNHVYRFPLPRYSVIAISKDIKLSQNLLPTLILDRQALHNGSG